MGSVSTSTQLLYTKLYPPQLPAIVARERLLRELDTARSAKLTTIVAGAGFGKTTLAAEFLGSRNLPSVWYQLEDTDRDLPVFISYLIAALRKFYKDFGGRTLDIMGSTKDRRQRDRSVLTTFISEIERHIEDEIFLVLDDFHEVNGSSEIVDALDFLLHHMPPKLHLIILSRTELNLDLSNLSGRRELVEVQESHLSFTTDETAKLFSQVFDLPVGEEDAATMTNLTEGWISGLVLLYHALKSDGRVGDVIMELGMPTTKVSQYLSRNVYQSQDNQLKEFLLKTSILSRINPEFCDAFLGKNNARETLAYLTKEHLFTLPLDEGGNSYRYHHLLRVFLQDLLVETVSPEELRDLNRGAALLWEEYGEPEEALRHYIEAGDYERVAEVLEKMADRLMKSSRTSFLYHVLSQLPGPVLIKYPKLALNLALASEGIGHYDKALEMYQEAATLFAEEGEVSAQMQCLRSATRVCMLRGRLVEAGEILNEMLKIIPGESDSWFEIPASLNSGFTWLGLASLQEQLYMGEVDDETIRMELLAWCGYASLMRGEYQRSLDLLSRVHRQAKRSDFMVLLLPVTYVFASATLISLGRYDEARKFAEMGLDIGKLVGEVPFVLLNRPVRALALALMDEREEALEEISLACKLSEGIEAIYVGIVSQLCAGTIYDYLGDTAWSVKHYRRAEQLARESKYKDTELVARLMAIGGSSDKIDGHAAREEAKSIVEALKEQDAGIMMYPSYLKLACIEYDLKNEDAAREGLKAAIPLDGRSEGIGWWKVFGNRLLPIIAEEFSRGEQLDFLGRVLLLMGPDSLPFLYPMKTSRIPKVREKARELIRDLKCEAAEPLRIKMLGGFEVVRGECRIKSEEWKSKKALAVLKYLAAHHGNGDVPREVLMELLWPGRSLEFASKNLNKALPSLRKTLEPEAGWGDSNYLITSGNSLRLELGKGGWIDIEVFRQKIKEAEIARESGDPSLYMKELLEVVALYDGDFLSEDLYDDWCWTIRERLREDYVDVLQYVAEEYLRVGDEKKALTYVEKAIASDPGREGLYRRLMELYIRMGNRIGMERAYERCCKYLHENFNISPSPETVELHKRLRGH